MNNVLRAGTASFLTVVLCFMNIVTGCKSAEPPPPQSQAAARLRPQARRRRK